MKITIYGWSTKDPTAFAGELFSPMAALLVVALGRRQGLGRCKAQIRPLSWGDVEPEVGTDDLPITSRTEAFQPDLPRPIPAAQVRAPFHPVPFRTA
jgi:hypothetical protein